MKYKFHRWMKIGHEIEVEAASESDARMKAERLVENENTADLETESSGLDLVEEETVEDGWYVVCGDGGSDRREGVWPVFYRDLNAAKACLRRFLENDKLNVCDETEDAKIEIAKDGARASSQCNTGRFCLERLAC